MGWFDEQLRYRKQSDEREFADAIKSIAGAITGVRPADHKGENACLFSALREILACYGIKPETEGVPSQLEAIEEQLDYVLQPCGVGYRQVTLDPGWHRHAIGPMLGRIKEDGSFVALIPDPFSGYRYFDPKTGRRIRLDTKTASLLSSDAVCFYEPLPLKELGMGNLLKFMAKQLRASDVLAYIGMLVLTALLGLLSPLFTKQLFGPVLASGSLRALQGVAGFMLCYSLCRVLMEAFQSLVVARIRIRQDVAVEAAVMQRIFSLPAPFFGAHSAGELSQRAQYIRLLCDAVIDSFGTAGLGGLFSLIYLVQISRYAPGLAVPSLIVMLLTFCLSVLTALVEARVARKRLELSAATTGLSYATISGIRKIKLAGAEKRMFARWARTYAEEARPTYDPPLFLKLSNTISLAISLFGTLVVYAFAIKGHVAVDDYYAFSTAYGMVSAAFASMAGLASTVASIRPILQMTKPILEAVPELSGDREIVTRLRGGIELSHVSFRYEDAMPDVVDDLSLTIRPGEYIAIVGATGCGKSTLMRLMLGFEKPRRGGIYYDRKDISTLDLKSLRRRIGVVMQDGTLFSGDIRANVTITAPGLSLDEVWEALEISDIAEDVRAMPMDLQTFLSEGGGGLSGGQKQRLLIARAIAPKPKILMFDEATSALDNVTQKKISDALNAMQCTRIVIAHRLSTIRHADRILFMDKGRIVEEGTYEELIEKNGRFAELVERQRLDIKTN